MQPGLSRAVPMAIIGFMFGALIVIVIRGLQGLDPIWAPGPGIILSAITMAIFFVWGIGAFDPRLSVHGSEEVEEAVHEELAEAASKPRSILTGSIWQVTILLLVFLLIVTGFAVIPGGLSLTQTVDPGASTTMVGYTEMALPFGGPTIEVSSLVIFAVFVIWALLSLIVAAGIIAYIVSFLSRGVIEVKAAGAGGGTVALPAPQQEPAGRDLRHTITTLVIFLVTFVVLYLVFYYAAIGLIFPQPQFPGLSIIFPNPQGQLVFLSALNAFIFMFIILRTALVLRVIGIVARWVAYQLRRIPNILQ